MTGRPPFPAPVLAFEDSRLMGALDGTDKSFYSEALKDNRLQPLFDVELQPRDMYKLLQGLAGSEGLAFSRRVRYRLRIVPSAAAVADPALRENPKLVFLRPKAGGHFGNVARKDLASTVTFKAFDVEVFGDTFFDDDDRVTHQSLCTACRQLAAQIKARSRPQNALGTAHEDGFEIPLSSMLQLFVEGNDNCVDVPGAAGSDIKDTSETVFSEWYTYEADSDEYRIVVSEWDNSTSRHTFAIQDVFSPPKDGNISWLARSAFWVNFESSRPLDDVFTELDSADEAGLQDAFVRYYDTHYGENRAGSAESPHGMSRVAGLYTSDAKGIGSPTFEKGVDIPNFLSSLDGKASYVEASFENDSFAQVLSSITADGSNDDFTVFVCAFAWARSNPLLSRMRLLLFDLSEDDINLRKLMDAKSSNSHYDVADYVRRNMQVWVDTAAAGDLLATFPGDEVASLVVFPIGLVPSRESGEQRLWFPIVRHPKQSLETYTQ